MMGRVRTMPARGGTRRRDRALRVLTWNLWWRYGPWQRRYEAIAATLAEVSPDLCGLQEVWDADGRNLAADLAGRLGRQWCFAAAAQSGDSEGRVALHARIEAPGGALPMFTTHLSYRPAPRR